MSTPTFEDFVQMGDDMATAGEYSDDDTVENSVRPFTDRNDLR